MSPELVESYSSIFKFLGAFLISGSAVFTVFSIAKLYRGMKKTRADTRAAMYDYFERAKKANDLISEYRTKTEECEKRSRDLDKWERRLYTKDPSGAHREKRPATRSRIIKKLEELSKRSDNPHEAQLAAQIKRDLERK